MAVIHANTAPDRRSLIRTGDHLADSGRTLLAEIVCWQSHPERDIGGSVANALRLVFADLQDRYAYVRREYGRKFGDLDADLGGGFPQLAAVPVRATRWKH